MIRSQKIASIAIVALAMTSTGASAHVTVRPAEAASGAATTYTVRVPSEGESATTSVELDIPANVVIVSVAGAAESYEMKKSGERVTSIVWKTSVPPGERAELNFTAQNPASGADITWKAHQHFADGSHADWVEAKGSKRPASVTVLKAPQ